LRHLKLFFSSVYQLYSKVIAAKIIPDPLPTLNNRGSKGKTIACTQSQGYDLSMKSHPKYLLGMITLLTLALPLWSQTITPEDRTFSGALLFMSFSRC
jgi:hypothetical protein